MKADLAELDGRYYDVEPPAEDDIQVNFKGINHFSWIDEATWRGRDLMDVLDHLLRQEGVIQTYTSEQALHEEGINGMAEMGTSDQVSHELYRRYGVLPAAGDRHIVEYAPWFLQGNILEDLHQWGVVRTTTDFRMDHWTEKSKRIQRFLDGEERFKREPSNEQMVNLLRALLGIEDFKTNVNLPNQGQMLNVPEDPAVEMNALVIHDRVTPFVDDTSPRKVRTLALRHVNNQGNLVEAAFAGDVDKGSRAFLSGPQTTLQPEQAKTHNQDLRPLGGNSLGLSRRLGTGSSTVLAESNQ